jgi:hypothetical protein
MARTRLATLAGAGVLAATLGACGTNLRAVVFVPERPPRAIVEVREVVPGAGYVWIRGYYRWGGRSYVWVPGRWERGPHAGARWSEGRWRHDRRHGWYWVEGSWR